MTVSRFPDHFSAVAHRYSRYRPRYPSDLFEYLASLSGGRDLAWDCATGNGQAAIALAGHFNKVIATDASAAQLAHAEHHPRVEYRLAAVEKSGLDSRLADLIAVAQALHWFDLPLFYAEARRVLKPGGLLAAWAYGKMHLADPGLRSVLGRFYHVTVGPYWPPERQRVEDGYRTLAFPFEEIVPPPFSLEAALTLDELAGYVSTWSATERYRRQQGSDPVPELMRELEKVWPDPGSPVTICWPLALRLGRMPNKSSEW